MSQVMRASVALGALALAVAVPGGAAALSAKKPKHTSVVNVVNTLPTKTPKNIKAKCGKSKSASKIRLRRTSHPTKNRVRTVTTYCNGGTRTVFYIKRTLPAVKTAGAHAGHAGRAGAEELPAHAAAQQRRRVQVRRRRLDRQLRRHHALQDRPGQPARRTPTNADAGGANKGTVFISSGDNFLAGLNLRASFQRFDAGLGPFYDSQAIDALGYDAVTIGNHEYDFGPGRLAEFIGLSRVAVHHRQHGLQRRADPADAAQQRPHRGLGRGRQGRREDRHHRRLPAGDPDDLVLAQRQVQPTTSINIVNAEAARLTAAGINKIILSSHLQNTENEKKVVAGLQNVDIVISGGADDLLANAGDRLVPGAGVRRSARTRRSPRTRPAPTCRSSPRRASTATSAA